MQFLLNLPPPLSFFVVSAITTSFALAGLYLVRKKYSADVLKENHEVAAIIFNAFGLFYGVLLAFVVFVTWNGYDEATKNLQLEANEVADIFHITSVFPDPAGETIRQTLMDYVNSVYNDELKRMSQDQVSLHSTTEMKKLLTLFYQVDEKSVPNSEIYGEALKRLNNLAEYPSTENICGERHRPTRDLVGPACWQRDQYFVHLLLRNEEHQGAIPDCSVAYGNDHDDFIFDLCSRSPFYRDQQGQRATVERRD